jgi:hypothetical protein
MGSDAAMMVATRPSSPPPADTQSQIPEHETWCYTTMGDTQCYAKPQEVAPNRLINVEPQNRYPLTAEAYRDELTKSRPIVAEAKPAEPGSTDESFLGKLLPDSVFGFSFH